VHPLLSDHGEGSATEKEGEGKTGKAREIIGVLNADISWLISEICKSIN
jgi:hypothetical protein